MSLYCALWLFTLSLHAYQLQHAFGQQEPLPEKFFKPIQFTRNGMQHFLKQVFNDRRYIQILPFDFSHLVQFLQEGKKNQKDFGYNEAIIRLFANKIKASRYVSAYACSALLEQMPVLFKDYNLIHSQQTIMQQARDMIKDVLYSWFLSKFSFFKSEPDSFFDELSAELAASLQKQYDTGSRVEKETFRQTLIHFLDILLLKLVWSPDDQELVWDSVKQVSQQLAALVDSNIINYDELDDLYKSLLESFCKFLDLAGSELSLATIEKIKKDVTSGSLLLVELQEQEDLIESKRQRLQYVVMQTEAKVRARLQGIITETIVY